MRRSLQAFLLLMALGAPSFASSFTTYTYVNLSGSNSYKAIITVDNGGTGGTGDLTIQLLNLQTAPWSDTGLISGIDFTLSGAGASLGRPTSYSGGEVATANSNGTLTQVYGALTELPAASLRWKNVGTDNTHISFTAMSGGSPSQLILGNAPAGTWGDYNGGWFNPSSITGHNPDIVGSATFVYSNVAGIGNTTTLSGVKFIDGTNASNTVSTTLTSTTTGTTITTAALTSTPEPGTFALSGACLLLAGLLRRRKHSRR